MEKYFVGIYNQDKMIGYYQEKTKEIAKEKERELKKEYNNFDVHVSVKKENKKEIVSL